MVLVCFGHDGHGFHEFHVMVLASKMAPAASWNGSQHFGQNSLTRKRIERQLVPKCAQAAFSIHDSCSWNGVPCWQMLTADKKRRKKKLQQRAGKIQSITITELNLCHIHVIFMSFTSAQAPGYARPKESHNGFVQFWFFRLSQFCIVLHSSA